MLTAEIIIKCILTQVWIWPRYHIHKPAR